MSSIGAPMAQNSEQRQQDALEAARDPEEPLSAEAAEKTVVEEATKAGVAAYQFDPDSSPSEKHEQIKSTIPPNLHAKTRKTSAAGLPTDIVNGTTNKPTDKPTTTDGSAEQPEPKKELTEEERWAPDRTGWAPRFQVPEDEMEAGETLLDHQTFLETKLDDKFFGDWYHNAAVICFACLASWLVALLGGGIGWILIVMATCGTYYRTSLRRVRRNFRDDIMREMAKNRLETDTETLEWINSFLVKFWPIYAPVMSDTIINSVDQVLSTAKPAFLDNLRMKTFVLGSKPPRLDHVKTYPKTEVDIVLMDWKFSFTPNDTMDLTARQLLNKTNPKVVLEVRMGKGMVSKGLDVIVEDFAFSGLMRVKVKLQVPFPHIERVDICFLGEPEIDYVCKPLGGEYLGFDINFIPGLETFIKDQIHGNLAPMMYEPNVFPIEIAKMLAGNPVDQAIGVVAVTLHGAHNLKNTDKFSGSPDPYAMVSVNNRAVLGRTKVAHDTSNPRWNETIYVVINSFMDSLTMQVRDHNEFLNHKDLGVASFPMESLEQDAEHENLTLDVLASGRPRGVLNCDIRFFPVLSGKMTETGADEPAPEMNTGIARFTVELAKDLDASKSMIGQLNPYAILLLNGKEIHVTKKLKRTNNPIFPDPSKEVLITDRKTARFGVMIKDDRDIAADPIVGRYQIKVNDLMRMMDKGQEWFHLQGAKSGRVKLKIDWKPVELKGIVGTAGYVNPIGVLRVHIMNARDLRNVETMGKSDPYVRLLLSGIEKRRTVTWNNNLNPDWNEIFYIPVHSAREKIALEVMDEENLGKDRALGSVELAAADYIKEISDGQYKVDDEKALITTPLRLEGRGTAKGTLSYTVAFYPTLKVADPEEEEEEAKAERAMEGRASLESARQSLDAVRKLPADIPGASVINGRPSVDTALSKQTTNGTDGVPGSPTSAPERAVPSLRLTPQNVHEYESGLIVFKLTEGQLAHSDVKLEVLMDDHVFPAYTSQKIKNRHAVFNDVGDAFVRELEFSKITLRLVEKVDKKGEEGDHAIAKLSGPTLPILRQGLYTPTELTLRSNDGAVSKVTVSMKYIPVNMKLDPSESYNNMGTLRVDVLDAADLPSADRNGYSDPFCRFKLDGKEVFKTKVQKKTLHPAWNEFFECQIKSRTGADFRLEVYDSDFGDRSDFLGATPISLADLEPFTSQEIALPLDGKSGVVRLKFLFKPDYVVRTRQGSSTFSGTFAAPGKIVGAPVKGVGMIGGGVMKGASFLKHGFMRSRSSKDDADIQVDTSPPKENLSREDLSAANSDVPVAKTPVRTPVLGDGVATPPTGSPATPTHIRSRSTASQFRDRLNVVSSVMGSKGDTGTATITIVSATGFPASANVRVVVKQATSKGMKEVHKTKAMKASQSGSSSPSSGSGSVVQFDQAHETFKVPSTAADTQFVLVVKDHATFGADEVFGEAILFVDDQGSNAGKERSVKVGDGQVIVKTAFLPSDIGASLRPGTSHSNAGFDERPDSPDSKKPRRSFLSKRLPSGSIGL